MNGPYDTLVKIVREMGNKTDARLATARYDDFANHSHGNSIRLIAFVLDGEEMFAGVNSVSLETPDTTSRLFATSYRWLQNVKRKGEYFVPRFRPEPGMEEKFCNLFSTPKTILELSNCGFIMPVMSGIYAPYVRESITKSRIIHHWGTRRYTPNGSYTYYDQIVEPLSTLILDGLKAYVASEQSVRKSRKLQK